MSERHEHTLALAAGGNDEALAELVRAYHDRVYRFGLRVCRDGFDADDAVQEAFAKLSRRPDVMRDRGVIAWLMTVVKHTCRRLLRPLTRERQHLGQRFDHEQVEVSDDTDTHAALERWQLVTSVHRAIAQLARPHREVLLLRDLEGLSGEETAAALGIELATMKSRLFRARAQLRELIGASRELT